MRSICALAERKSLAQGAQISADPEFSLLLATCRPPTALDRTDAIKHALAAPINWQRLAKLVRRHRVAGLVADGLHRAAVDPGVLAASGLAAQAAAAATKSLRLTAESARLQAHFDQLGLPALILKGAPLGVFAFGQPAIKEFWDIDLLVPRGCVIAARRALFGLGYQQHEPAALDDQQFDRFADFSKEAIFVDAAGHAVELHWRLTDMPSSLAGIDPFATSCLVDVGGRQMRTLAGPLQLAYLALHGQNHGWSRVKWIAEFHGFSITREPVELIDMVRRATDLGASRQVNAALLLAHDLFGDDAVQRGTPLPRRNLSMRVVLAANRRAIAAPIGGSDVPFYSLTALGIAVGKMLTAHDWRSRAEILGHSWNRPVERALDHHGSALRYSLRRLVGILVRLPRRLFDDAVGYRRARAQIEDINP